MRKVVYNICYKRETGRGGLPFCEEGDLKKIVYFRKGKYVHIVQKNVFINQHVQHLYQSDLNDDVDFQKQKIKSL